MLSHVVRRAIQAGYEQLSRADVLEKQANAFAELDYEMPTWGIALLGFTLVAFMLIHASIEYTVRYLIVNLAIVESPTSATVAIYKPVPSNDDPDAPLEKRDIYSQDLEVEKATVFSKPVTSSIRSTVTHLQSVGGFRARWRGIRAFGLYSSIAGITNLLFMLLPTPLAPVIGTFAGALVAARLHCVWTHTTISMPSNKTVRQRLAPLRNCATWRQLAGPTLLKTAAVELSLLLVVGQVVLSVNRVNDLIDAKSTACASWMFWLAAPLFVGLISFVFLIIPSYVVLIRKEASLLPADDDTVVPIDRTFGGRVNEETGILSAKDAWKGFTTEAWTRVVKTYVKFAVISVAIMALSFQTIFAQLYIIMGDDLFVLLDSAMARLETLGF